MHQLAVGAQDFIVLRRFTGNFDVPRTVRTVDHLEAAKLGVLVDTETTGLDQRMDVVIEIGVLPFFFDSRTGQLLEVCPAYNGLQDPGRPLDPEVTEHTGITDADVAGQVINWKHVHQMLSQADMVLAHNAKFDRPMVHKALHAAGQRPPNVAWGCSMSDIDWKKEPCKPPSLALGVLAAWHGFFFTAHRAINDCMATLHLLDLSGKLLTLFARAKQGSAVVAAVKAPFDAKDALKARKYQWNADAKYWWLELPQDMAKLAAEQEWLTQNVYRSLPNQATITNVAPEQRFL